MSNRRIIAQTGIQLLGKIAGIGFGVGAIAIITRALGLEGYGYYATIMAFLQLFGIAVDLGLNVMAPTMLAEVTANSHQPIADSNCIPVDRSHASAIGYRLSASDVLSNIFTIRLVAAVIVFTIAATVAFFIPAYTPAVRVGIALATFSFLAIVLTQILQAPFQVATDMRWPVLADVLGRAVLVGGVAFVAWQSMGLNAMIAATVIGNIVTLVAVFFAVRRRVAFSLAFDFLIWRNILTRSWPIALSIIFNLVYLRADQVILSFLKPATDVGIYAAPYRLIDVLTQFPHMVMGLVLPMIAAAWVAGDRAKFHGHLQRTFDGMALLGLPLTAGAIVLGTPIMTLIAGREFAVSGPILAVLALALLGIFLGQPFGYAIVAVGAQRTMLWGYATVAVATLIGYFLTIPIWSYWGAAVMTVFSETIIAYMTYSVVRRASGLHLRWRVAGSAMLASVAMTTVLYFAPLPLIPLIALGAIVYGVVVIVLPPTRRIVMGAFA